MNRFMRGEKNIDRIAVMTPSTPGSVSTYQRMHSNESEYSIGPGTATVTGSGTISATASGGSASGLNGNGGGAGGFSNI